MSSRRPNLTGFDPAKLAAAAGQPARDPWARNEAWRYTGPFTRYNRFKGALPGFGIAVVAFAGYMVYEQIFLTPAHGHGEAHHAVEEKPARRPTPADLQ